MVNKTLHSMQSSSSISSSSSRRRMSKKRVRFFEGDENSNGDWECCGATSSSSSSSSSTPSPKRRRRQRVMDYVPSSSADMMSEEDDDEKCCLWLQRSEHLAIRKESNNEARESCRQDMYRTLLGQPHFSFRETYSNIFALCLKESENDDYDDDDDTRSDDVFSMVSPEIVAFMATNEARGLEDKTAYPVALHRRVLRAQQIHHVLRAQALWNDPDTLRKVARTLSTPSRKLAETLGMIDATAALMVYCDAVNSNNTTTTTDDVKSLVEETQFDTAAAEMANTSNGSSSTGQYVFAS